MERPKTKNSQEKEKSWSIYSYSNQDGTAIAKKDKENSTEYWKYEWNDTWNWLQTNEENIDEIRLVYIGNC